MSTERYPEPNLGASELARTRTPDEQLAHEDGYDKNKFNQCVAPGG